MSKQIMMDSLVRRICDDSENIQHQTLMKKNLKENLGRKFVSVLMEIKLPIKVQ